jgi:transcriptional regulator with XRE-family HTH domain
MDLTLGGLLKLLRESLGLTQAQLAAKLGVDPSLLSRVERGERTLAGKTAASLRELLERNKSQIPPELFNALRARLSEHQLDLGSQLAELLYRARRALELTQSQMSALLGVSQPAVSAWEYGRCKPQLGPLKKLVAHLKQVGESKLAERISELHLEASRPRKIGVKRQRSVLPN